jgi:hypothetical protein
MGTAYLGLGRSRQGTLPAAPPEAPLPASPLTRPQGRFSPVHQRASAQNMPFTAAVSPLL